MPRYNGVLPLYRRDFLIYKNLSSDEKILRYAVISNMSWNEKDHPARFGMVNMTQKELADYLFWSESKVSRVLPILLSKNPGFKRDGYTFIADDYDAFIYKTACQREKTVAEQQKEFDEKQLAKRRAAISNTKEVVSDSQEERQDFSLISPLVKSSSDSFKGNSLESIDGPNETYEQTVNRFKSIEAPEEDLLSECPICKNGKRFIDCCAEAFYYSLKDWYNKQKVV